METVEGIAHEFVRVKYWKERKPEKKKSLFRKVESIEKIFFNKDIYYVRPDKKSKNFYRVSGGFSKLAASIAKQQIDLGHVYEKVHK